MNARPDSIARRRVVADREADRQGPAARPSWRMVVAYALPAIPTAALALPLTVYVAPFYAVEVGLGTALVGLLFLAVRLVDIGVDPLIGFLGDRTQTRWGRRRPWLVGVTPPLMVALYAFFNPPPAASGLYLTLCLIAVYLGYSVLMIAHTAWGAELSGAYHERSRIAGTRQFAFIAGMLLVLILPAVLETATGAGARQKVAAMGWFVIVGLPLAVGLAAALAPEPRHPRPPGEGLGPMLARLGRHRALRSILAVDLAIGLATSITAALFLFLVEKTYGLKQSSLVLLLYFVAGLVGAPGWTLLSYRIGKHRALAVSALFGAAVLPLFVLAPRDGSGAAMVVVLSMLYGLSYGAAPVLLYAIMGDVADEETAATGERRAGAAFALLVLTNKLGFALSIGITYPLLALIGFSGKAGASNTPVALTAIEATFIGPPTLLLILAAAWLWRFPLDETAQRAVAAKLAVVEA